MTLQIVTLEGAELEAAQTADRTAQARHAAQQAAAGQPDPEPAPEPADAAATPGPGAGARIVR